MRIPGNILNDKRSTTVTYAPIRPDIVSVTAIVNLFKKYNHTVTISVRERGGYYYSIGLVKHAGSYHVYSVDKRVQGNDVSPFSLHGASLKFAALMNLA
jgi:hypothetical protein